MAFGLGVLTGVAVMAFIAWWVSRIEWAKRIKLERRLEKLERNLLCGKGVFGCNGGPDCKWEHK